MSDLTEREADDTRRELANADELEAEFGAGFAEAVAGFWQRCVFIPVGKEGVTNIALRLFWDAAFRYASAGHDADEALLQRCEPYIMRYGIEPLRSDLEARLAERQP